MENSKITLATLPNATAQEVFDQVVSHLRTQGKKSISLINSCRYRHVTDDDIVLRCAAGCLIGDNEYRPEFEGKSWMGLVDKLGPFILPDNHADLIRTLQLTHDKESIDAWELAFKNIASDYKLQYKPRV
jgi:hypothetical protein